jgi:hypothetical protein
MRTFLRGGAALILVACGASAPDARYPARADGCAVRTYPGESRIPVDDLGPVRVDCGAGEGCERKLLDRVCELGGDVAWGTGENAPGAATLTAHAAHSKRVAEGTGARGCPVRVFGEVSPHVVENIGTVTALCAEDDSRDVCLRELEDQVCLLGGDVLWHVEGPQPEDTSVGRRQRMRGRAAHARPVP